MKIQSDKRELENDIKSLQTDDRTLQNDNRNNKMIIWTSQNDNSNHRKLIFFSFGTAYVLLLRNGTFSLNLDHRVIRLWLAGAILMKNFIIFTHIF